MKDYKEIQDNEIRIIGKNYTNTINSGGENNTPKFSKRWIVICYSLFSILCIIVVIWLANINFSNNNSSKDIEVLEIDSKVEESFKIEIKNPTTEVLDTVIYDVELTIFTPRGGTPALYVGKLSQIDTNIILSVPAADIRADNGGIVGSFILDGKQISRGMSKSGFCAIINGNITIGMADNTSLFEMAAESGGYFFRQYPLVYKGLLVENKPRGKHTRKALCECDGEIFIVVSRTNESYHDFAQVLVDMGVNNAISLMGGGSYAWAYNVGGEIIDCGLKSLEVSQNQSYIYWYK